MGIEGNVRHAGLCQPHNYGNIKRAERSYAAVPCPSAQSDRAHHAIKHCITDTSLSLQDRGDLKAILWHLTKSEIKSASGVYCMGVMQVKSSLFAALLFRLYMIDTMSAAG